MAQEPTDIAIKRRLANVQSAWRTSQDPVAIAGFAQAEATPLLAQAVYELQMGQGQVISKLDSIVAALGMRGR